MITTTFELLSVTQGRGQDLYDLLSQHIVKRVRQRSGELRHNEQLFTFVLEPPTVRDRTNVTITVPFPLLHAEVVQLGVAVEGDTRDAQIAHSIVTEILDSVRSHLLLPMEKLCCRKWLISESSSLAGLYWIDDGVRISPPAGLVPILPLQSECPIVLDFEYQTIDDSMARARSAGRTSKRIAALLSVILRTNLYRPHGPTTIWARGRVDVDGEFSDSIALHHRAFVPGLSEYPPEGMPALGQDTRPGSLTEVARPDFSERSLKSELEIPSDVLSFFLSFSKLATEDQTHCLRSAVLYQKALNILNVYPSGAITALVSAAEALGSLLIGSSEPPVARFRAATVHLLQLGESRFYTVFGVKFFNEIYGDRSKHVHFGTMLASELIGLDNPFSVDYSGFREKFWPLEMVVAAAITQFIFDPNTSRDRARDGWRTELAEKTSRDA